MGTELAPVRIQRPGSRADAVLANASVAATVAIASRASVLNRGIRISLPVAAEEVWSIQVRNSLPNRQKLRTACSDRVGGASERRLELLGELDVEEAERELVVLHQVHELLRLLDLRQVAGLLRPHGTVGRRDVLRHQIVRGDPLAELGAVDAGVVEVLDLARRPATPSATRSHSIVRWLS